MPDEVTLDYEPGVLRVLQTKSETKAFYDKIAKVYDLLAEHSERPMREAGLRLLAAAPGEHVLEIGFGTGHILAELANAVGPTGRVFGIDISENMLAHARDVLSNKGLIDRASLDCGDAESLPYGDDSMDGIFMCFTLELFDTPDIPKVLAECKRVLRPGGRIVVVAVSKEGKEGLVIHAFEWTHRHFPNLMDCRPIYARRALEATGFVIEDSLTRIHVGSRGDCEGFETGVLTRHFGVNYESVGLLRRFSGIRPGFALQPSSTTEPPCRSRRPWDAPLSFPAANAVLKPTYGSRTASASVIP